jgi:hypothetical protein
MLHCRGRHKIRVTCNRVIYRCKMCGSTGCDQNEQAQCTGQNFLQGKCIKCGDAEKEPV